MEATDLEILLCVISDAHYGIPVGNVQAVYRAVAISAVPGMPQLLEGVIDVRGEVVPVIDVRNRFGLPSRECTLTDHIVIMRAGVRPVAIRVDRVIDLSRVAQEDLDASTVVTPWPRHIRGTAPLRGGLVVIYNPEEFLSAAEEDILDDLHAAGMR